MSEVIAKLDAAIADGENGDSDIAGVFVPNIDLDDLRLCRAEISTLKQLLALLVDKAEPFVIANGLMDGLADDWMLSDDGRYSDEKRSPLFIRSSR